MANNIKLKRSAVAGKQPTVADLQLGELAVNTYDGKLYTKKNDGTESIIEIGAGGGTSAYTRYTYTATSGQTTFSATYTVNYVNVFLNGVMLSPDDYTATSGTSIVLTVGAVTGDIIDILAWTLTPIPTVDAANVTGDFPVIAMDTTYAGAIGVGEMAWDSGNQTPSIGLNSDVTLQLGQENVALVYNGTGSTIPNGSVVSVVGVQGQRPSIALADADSESTSASTLGIATQDITDGSEGFVCTFGLVRGINTNGFTAGQPIYLSQTAGQFTSTRPSAPAHTVFLGWIIKVNAASGELFVNISNGWEISELHDVKITSPVGGNLLSYDETNGYWKNIYLTDGTGISITETTGGAVTVGIDSTVATLTGTQTLTNKTLADPKITIGGSNGTVGQVLTSAGSGLAPTWQSVASSGKISRTASGSITAGQGVQINSDGTVSIPSVTLTTSVGSAGQPTTNQIATLADTRNQIVYLPLIDRYFTAWINTSRYIYGSIGTPLSDGSITWSSQIAVDASGSTYYSGLKIEYYPPTGAILLIGAFNTQANWAFVISPTASTFTVGTATSLGRYDFPDVSYTYDSVNQKFVVIGTNGSTGNTQSAVISISGTTASTSTPISFGYGISNLSLSYDSPSGKILATGYYNSASQAWIGTVSGTSITYTAAINLGLGANVVMKSTTYISGALKHIICYYNGSTTNVALATVSGSSVSVGSATSITSTDVSASYPPSFTYDVPTDRIVCIYTRSADTYFCTFTMSFSGTTINSPSTVTVMRSAGSYYSDIALDTTRIRVGSITNNFGTVITYTSTYGTASMSANNFLGFAESTVTNGQTLNVTTIGGVNTNQSGLTTGSKYYISGASGNLSTSGTIPAGMALSATSILTKG